MLVHIQCVALCALLNRVHQRVCKYRVLALSHAAPPPFPSVLAWGAPRVCVPTGALFLYRQCVRRYQLCSVSRSRSFVRLVDVRAPPARIFPTPAALAVCGPQRHVSHRLSSRGDCLRKGTLFRAQSLLRLGSSPAWARPGGGRSRIDVVAFGKRDGVFTFYFLSRVSSRYTDPANARSLASFVSSLECAKETRRAARSTERRCCLDGARSRTRPLSLLRAVGCLFVPASSDLTFPTCVLPP